MKRKVYVNDERTTFVEIWTDEETGEEIVNVARREHPDHTWGPPTRVRLEDS